MSAVSANSMPGSSKAKKAAEEVAKEARRLEREQKKAEKEVRDANNTKQVAIMIAAKKMTSNDLAKF
tara:strand:- start:727 stop:927 length:201 start_codon:yes stop_codon:yes gene_type:complete